MLACGLPLEGSGGCFNGASSNGINSPQEQGSFFKGDLNPLFLLQCAEAFCSEVDEKLFRPWHPELCGHRLQADKRTLRKGA